MRYSKLVSPFRVFLAILALVSIAGTTPAFATEVGPLDTNASGEYSYIPDDALSEEDLEGLISGSGFDVATYSTESHSAVRNVTTTELGGSTRYATSAMSALHEFSSADVVLLACGESGYADAIAASGLAGALDAPVLLTQVGFIPNETQQALDTLAPKKIILLGGNGVISTGVEKSLRAKYGSENVERLGGSTRYDTQMAIYSYGREHGLWTGDTVIVVNGANYPDALAASPVAFDIKAPIFFTNEFANLPPNQLSDLETDSSYKNIIAVGEYGVVSNSTFSNLSSIASNRGGSAVRLGGNTRYDTAVAIANYTIDTLGFSWDNVGFATGQSPYDALSGGIIQGKARSVILLIDEANKTCLNALRQHASEINSEIRFFGGTGVIPGPLRIEICQAASISAYGNVSYRNYSVTMSQMANLQVGRNEPNSYTYADFYEALNPMKYPYGASSFYQFAILNDGYSGISASTINTFVADNCAYSESAYGRTSNLKNAGDYFVEAAKTYGVNEVYLLAHAIWESGWGCSELAGGWTPTENGEVIVNGVHYPYYAGTTYYNFYGIGAVDTNALSGGRAMAVKESWTSPRSAILGAAKWISQNYHNRSAGRQNTLYLMKWDLEGVEQSGSAWHEYCTGTDSWVVGISNIMNNCYSLAGFNVSTVPLKYEVPVYKS